MTICADEQITTPIPDIFGHVEGLLPIFCDNNERLILEFPAIAVWAAKQTFSIIVVNTTYGWKGLFQASGKDDGSGLKYCIVVRYKFKPALVVAHISNPGLMDRNGRILADFLMRKFSEFVWFHSVSRQKTVRFLR